MNKYKNIYNLSDWQATYLHEQIKSEPEIVTVDAHTLQEKVTKNTAVCLVDELWNNPLWFIGTTEYENIADSVFYERWSLWVNPERRGKRIASALLNELHVKMNHLPLVCLTKVDKVQSLCEHRDYSLISVWEVQKTPLWKEMEKLWSIDWYSIYFNPVAKELFSILQGQWWK